MELRLKFTGGVATLKGVKVIVDPETHLGGEGGPAVARIGDHVSVGKRVQRWSLADC